MDSPNSLYRLLSVSPDADASVIEAAYRALIKKHHPDVRTSGTISPAHRAAQLNEAFAVLRDPEKRARYDADQKARQDSLRPILVPTGPEHPGAIPPRSGGRWAFAGFAAIVAAIILLAMAQFEDQSGGADPAISTPAQPTTAAAAPRTSVRPPPVDRNTVDRAVREFDGVYAKGGLRGAIGYSIDCFWALNRKGSVADLDFCVAFDQAASALDGERSGVFGLPQIPHLQPQNLSTRHLGAARLLSDDEDWIEDRLEEVRSLTLAAVAASLARRSPVEAPTIATESVEIPAEPIAESPPAPPVTVHRNRIPRAVARSAPRATRDPQRTEEFLEREGYIY